MLVALFAELELGKEKKAVIAQQELVKLVPRFGETEEGEGGNQTPRVSMGSSATWLVLH